MHKLILIPFIVFGFIFSEGIFREKIYKSVDEKGTINFLDNPTSPVIATKEEPAKQDGGEVLKTNEIANRPGQEIYKSVDEKGTINFSDNPTSPVITTKKGAAKQDGGEVLKRNEVANRPRQEVYKPVDEKGTINFSDNPTSLVIATKEGSAKQDGGEVSKRDEVANRRPLTDSEIKAKLLTMSTWRGDGSSSGGGSSRTVRS
jgi:hypothetical protein